MNGQQVNQFITVNNFSVRVNGQTVTPTPAATPIVVDAQLPALPNPGLPLTGATPTTTPLYVVGHPNQTIGSGTLVLSLTDTNVNDLTIVLTKVGTSLSFTLPKSTGTALNQTYTLPAAFLDAAIDGQYVLSITGVAGDTGNLSAFTMTFNPSPTSLTGNTMDQNSDATPGEDPETTPFTGTTPGDDYAVPTPTPVSAAAPVTFSGAGFPSGPYDNNSLPLIVSGPHITTTSVSGTAGTTTGTTADNLIVNDNVGSVGLTFDRNVQVSSVTPQQVLSLIGPAGPISGNVTITPEETYRSTDTTPTTYPSTDNSTQLYPSIDATFANPITIPATAGATVTSNIVIPSTGNTFTLANLDVALAITYPRDTNLSVTLISSTGISIPLFAAVGGTGANFGVNPPFFPQDYTIFGDAGTLPIVAGRAPFDSGDLLNYPLDVTQVYRPASPLSQVNGLPIDGTWSLKIVNNSGLQAGKFDGWALIATPQPAPAANGLPAGAVQPGEPIPVLPASPTTEPLDSAITFPSTGGTYTIANLSTTITLKAPVGGNLADLSGILTGPNGVEKTLFTAGSGAFSGTGVQTRTITTLDSVSGLNSFLGVPIDGKWTLTIFDQNTADKGDVLNAWSLNTTPQPLAQQQAAEPVPNTPASSLSSTINIPDNVPLNNLEVRVNLTAPAAGNLTAVLFGPNGRSIRLFTNVASTGANFANTLFSDTGTSSITTGTAPFSATFRPEQALGFFVAGGLTSIQGNWTLVLTDTVPNPGGPSAVLNGWSLVNTPPAGTGLANTFQVNFPTQQLSGTYQMTVGAGILGAAPAVNSPSTVADPSLGTAANPNLNAGVDVLRGASASGLVPTALVTYNSAPGSVTIPAGGNAATSQITVPDNFLIQGDQTSSGQPGLTVGLNITFARPLAMGSVLSGVLTAPDGTVIQLFHYTGTGRNIASFTDVTFNDNVNPPTLIKNSQAPFFGNFNPETPLADLAGHSSGANGGVWSLQIINTDPTNAGTLTGFSLNFEKPLPSSGLGNPVADRQSVSFRIFNLLPTNPLANSTWTAVGPAGVTTTVGEKGTFAGSVATVAVDPSDPTGNTVFVGSTSGGIWKTTNFLTTEAGGPTYLPVTDFGPNFSLNVGGIAVFGRNNDPNQSVVFAGTGFAQSTATYNSAGGQSGATTYTPTDGTAGRGVGILMSPDGGQTWTLLDSLDNTKPEALRDHAFVGDSTYKIVVDPTPQPNGQIIVYAALGGPTGGLYQSLNGGLNWKLLSGNVVMPNSLQTAAATDIILDPASKSPSTGNLTIFYAAFQDNGVYTNNLAQGQSLTMMGQSLGKDPLIVGPGFPAQPITVGRVVSPNSQGATRIILAKPALTDNAAENLLYQDWLYAAVEGQNGQFIGLYVTKDRGENWTLAQLNNLPGNASVKAAEPTNDNLAGNSYDPTSSRFTSSGNYNLTLTVDPTNPNIVYLGGSQDFQESGLIRVDLTDIYDAHNFVSFATNRNDGGLYQQLTTGGVNVMNPTTLYPAGAIYNPPNYPPNIPTPYLNFRHAPNTGLPGSSPFDLNATLVVLGVAPAAGFTNDGSGVTWTPFDEPLKANAGDISGSTNLHQAISLVDPVTGNVRLIFADDQGVFTALVNPDGTLDNGIGTDASANYSRNGNLQDEQFYYGAAQPSNVAAQVAGALFYASGPNLLAVQSDPSLLKDGNITWDDSAVVSAPQGSSRFTTANTSIVSSDRSGSAIAVDQTGSGTEYEFDVPSLGGNLTDFFRINGVGQTTGLAGNVAAEFPFGGQRASGTSGNDLAGAIANGQIPLGNFAVNPLNGSQILIGSATGRLYETTNSGVQFLPIGQPNNFDGTQLSAIVYGAPDPTAQAGIGNLNNFIYVGTVGLVGTQSGNQATDGAPTGGGHIYETRSGGQGWTDISSGLDGSSVVGIYPSPDRGSHAAYAVTLNGVFFSADTVGLAAAGRPIWTNITSNLTSITKTTDGFTSNVLSPFLSNTGAIDQGTAQYGGFTSIVADYRYEIPNANVPGTTFPVLYVSGYGGVFRSLDNGTTWTVFPNTTIDNAPVDGGYLPSVDVTNLQLDLGTINPATGHPTLASGDPEILLASTFGRGEFAIGLAPVIIPGTIMFTPATNIGTPANPVYVTRNPTPTISGISEVSNFGNVVTITLTDKANGDILGTGTTDSSGNFSITLVNNGTDSSFFQSSKTLNDKNVLIQATDSSGAKGNTTTFTYNLVTDNPLSPTSLVLERGSDSGRSNSDDITNLSFPPQAGPGAPLNIVAPLFDVTTPAPTNPLTPNPIGLTVDLFRATSLAALRAAVATGPSAAVATVSAPSSTGGTVTLADQLLVSNGLPNGTYYYQAIQVDQIGNVSGGSPVLTLIVNTVAPPTLGAPSLDPASNTGLNKSLQITNITHPFFDVPASSLGMSNGASDQLLLYRSFGGGTPVLVGTAPVGATQVTDQVGVPSVPPSSTTYLYQVAQVRMSRATSAITARAPR